MSATDGAAVHVSRAWSRPSARTQSRAHCSPLPEAGCPLTPSIPELVPPRSTWSEPAGRFRHIAKCTRIWCPVSRRRSAMRTAFATPAGPPRFFKNLPGGPGLRLQALLADREMRKHLARRESGAGTPAASHSRPSWVSAMNLRVPSLGGPLGQSLPAGSGMP